MNKKALKCAAVRALHTCAQTVGGVLTLDAIMSGITWQLAGRAALAGLLAGVISFTKSLCIGIPEVGSDETE